MGISCSEENIHVVCGSYINGVQFVGSSVGFLSSGQKETLMLNVHRMSNLSALTLAK